MLRAEFESKLLNNKVESSSENIAHFTQVMLQLNQNSPELDTTHRHTQKTMPHTESCASPLIPVSLARTQLPSAWHEIIQQ